MLDWKLNERQEKFLNEILKSQTHENALKAVQQMQLRIKEFEKEIREDQTRICASSIIGIPKESIHKKDVVLAIMGTITDNHKPNAQKPAGPLNGPQYTKHI
jgi:hypothetical protein